MILMGRSGTWITILLICTKASTRCSTQREQPRPIAHSQLLSEPFLQGLDHADLSVPFRDFAAGRKYIIAMSEIKFSHWRQLPWFSFCIRHPNNMIANECARRSLQLAAGFEDRTNAHYLIGVLCLDGGLLHRQMMVFAQDVEDMNLQEDMAKATVPVYKELAISMADDDKTDIDDKGVLKELL